MLKPLFSPIQLCFHYLKTFIALYIDSCRSSSSRHALTYDLEVEFAGAVVIDVVKLCKRRQWRPISKRIIIGGDSEKHDRAVDIRDRKKDRRIRFQYAWNRFVVGCTYPKIPLFYLCINLNDKTVELAIIFHVLVSSKTMWVCRHAIVSTSH